MSTVLILNDPPYGTERSYNALRLALSLAQRPNASVKVFLMGDAASCAEAGQHVPAGYDNLETMLKALGARGAPVGVCGTCMDARGIAEQDLVAGAHRSAMDELTAWTAEAEQVITF